MEQSAFITHVCTHLHDELRDAIIQQAPNRLRPILSDVEKDIRVRADFVCAKYWVRVPCTLMQCVHAWILLRTSTYMVHPPLDFWWQQQPPSTNCSWH